MPNLNKGVLYVCIHLLFVWSVSSQPGAASVLRWSASPIAPCPLPSRRTSCLSSGSRTLPRKIALGICERKLVYTFSSNLQLCCCVPALIPPRGVGTVRDYSLSNCMSYDLAFTAARLPSG